MKKRLIEFFLFALCCALFAVTTQAQMRVAPLPIKQRTLANGLKVVTLEDNASPSVSVQVWYSVGSKNDPEGRSGFAHMFEHLMFKSTKNLKNEQMDRLTEDVGGNNNASTTDDVTNYYETIPSNYLETLIWAEAERMANLNVDNDNFKSERKVVQEEFRQSVLAQPYGMFSEYIQKLLYTTHPYRRTTIGTIEDLDAASLEDIQRFHSTFYRPDDATLIIVGDFDQKQLDAWVDKYFDKVSRPSTVIPRVTVKEPALTQEKRFERTAPNVPFPAVAISYLGPQSNSADIPALRIAEAILAGGESSRLYQSLIYKQQIAQQASFALDNRVDGGQLHFSAVMSEGHTAAEGEKALLEELKKIQDTPVTASELAKAKNQLITNAYEEREQNEGKAFAIGQAIIYSGDANAVNTSIQKLQAVTAADVERVMNKYFSDHNRVVLYYTNQEGAAK
jgi:zinc protease